MEKLRIAPKNLYVIEVNDAGDTITLDPDDIELIFKLERAYKASEEAQKALKRKLLVIDKQQDKAVKGEIMTSKQKAKVEAYKEAFADMRAAFDAFLGEGACQKIFGDRNYLEMFDDLLEQLTPHLDKMKLNKETVMGRIKDKYKIEDEDTIK